MSYMKRALEEGVQVKVYLNRNERESFMDGYKGGDPLELAVDYRVDAEMLFVPGQPSRAGHWKTSDGMPHGILNQAFMELNRDDPKSGWAKKYRDRGMRSLSVGDVVVVGESAYACEKIGWRTVSFTSESVL